MLVFVFFVAPDIKLVHHFREPGWEKTKIFQTDCEGTI